MIFFLQNCLRVLLAICSQTAIPKEEPSHNWMGKEELVRNVFPMKIQEKINAITVIKKKNILKTKTNWTLKQAQFLCISLMVVGVAWTDRKRLWPGSPGAFPWMEGFLSIACNFLTFSLLLQPPVPSAMLLLGQEAPRRAFQGTFLNYSVGRGTRSHTPWIKFPFMEMFHYIQAYVSK